MVSLQDVFLPTLRVWGIFLIFSLFLGHFVIANVWMLNEIPFSYCLFVDITCLVCYLSLSSSLICEGRTNYTQNNVVLAYKWIMMSYHDAIIDLITMPLLILVSYLWCFKDLKR